MTQPPRRYGPTAWNIGGGAPEVHSEDGARARCASDNDISVDRHGREILCGYRYEEEGAGAVPRA